MTPEQLLERTRDPDALPALLEDDRFPDELRLAVGRELLRHPRRRRFLARVLGFYALIPKTDDAPAVHRSALMRALRTQRSDVAAIGLWIRQRVPRIGQTLCSGQEGYRFSLEGEVCEPWQDGNVTHALTRIQSTRLGMESYYHHVERHGLDHERRQVAVLRRDLDRVIEDLAALR